MSVRGKQTADPSKAKVRKRPKPQLEGVGPAAQIESIDSAALQRAAFDPSTASPADILALQRGFGNKAVSSLIQTKVTVGPVGDHYEREADRVADQVLNQQPAGDDKQQVMQRQEEDEEDLQMQPLAATITPKAPSNGSKVQRQEEEEEDLQMQPAQAGLALVQRQEEDEELGFPLPEEATEPMEPEIPGLGMEGEEEGLGFPTPEEATEPMEPEIPELGMEGEEEEGVEAPEEAGEVTEPEVPEFGTEGEEEEEIQLKPLPGGGVAQHQPSLRRAPTGIGRVTSEGSTRAGPGMERSLAMHKGGGSPLPDETRSYMEPRFGADFSDVRVHTGGEAAKLNKGLHARAFTHGKDIYFGSGKFDPESGSGKRLLAHELTHVVQQSGKKDRIARWGGLADNATGHDELTADAFDKMRDPDTGKTGFSHGAQEYVKHHSESMDLRFGFLAMVIAAGNVYQPLLSRMAKDPKAYDNLQGYWRRGDEAPNHAEAGKYVSGGGGAADQARVQVNLDKAIAAWDKDNPSQSLSMLGLAVHTAEDRGAHGDGAPGTGHDPRRSIKPPPGAQKAHLWEGPDWKSTDCDSKAKNPGGYAFSVEQAIDVLTRFRTAVKHKNRKTKLQEYKKPGKLLTGWRSAKIFMGLGHPDLKWDRDWKGKSGFAKKTGAVLGAPLGLGLKYGYKGGKSGLAMGHRTARQIWKGRVGGSGGLLGRMKRGWKGFGRSVKEGWSGRGGIHTTIKQEFREERERYLAEKQRAGGGKMKKAWAWLKHAGRNIPRGLRSGLAYGAYGLQAGVLGALGVGATALLGAGLGVVGSLAAYGLGGGLGLAGGTAMGAMRGLADYTSRPLQALGKPLRALSQKVRGRESGEGYEGITIIGVARKLGLDQNQTMSLINVDKGSWGALARSLKRLEKEQRKEFVKLTPEKLDALQQLGADDLEKLHNLKPEQIAQISPDWIAHMRGWLRTLKEEDAPYESTVELGFDVPQLTALGVLGPKKMNAVVEELKKFDNKGLDKFKELNPTRIKSLAKLKEDQLGWLCFSLRHFKDDQFDAFVGLKPGQIALLEQLDKTVLAKLNKLTAGQIAGISVETIGNIPDWVSQ